MLNNTDNELRPIRLEVTTAQFNLIKDALIGYLRTGPVAKLPDTLTVLDKMDSQRASS